MKTPFPLHCLVCNQELDPVTEGTTQPNKGLTFVSTGNYGSQIYDPLVSAMQLHAVVCDECIGSRINRLIGVTPSQARPTFDYRPLISVEELLDEG